SFRALERFHDLAIRELRLLHRVELPLLEILLLIPPTERGYYRRFFLGTRIKPTLRPRPSPHHRHSTAHGIPPSS
ncbi:hypothetical protein, partial [Burkholderia vietnamiensis]|uniref:hypothetical protein n=1 Tax=Burkholderia vietnamiensis TaxID=60552 RepID=UPI001ABB0573